MPARDENQFPPTKVNLARDGHNTIPIRAARVFSLGVELEDGKRKMFFLFGLVPSIFYIHTYIVSHPFVVLEKVYRRAKIY